MKEIEVDGKTYTYDDDSLMSTEMEVIQRHTGLTYKGYLEGLRDQDINALHGLVWVVRSRAGEPEGFGEYVYNLRSIVIRDLDADEQEDEPELDPTKTITAAPSQEVEETLELSS